MGGRSWFSRASVAIPATFELLKPMACLGGRLVAAGHRRLGDAQHDRPPIAECHHDGRPPWPPPPPPERSNFRPGDETGSEPVAHAEAANVTTELHPPDADGPGRETHQPGHEQRPRHAHDQSEGQASEREDRSDDPPWRLQRERRRFPHSCTLPDQADGRDRQIWAMAPNCPALR
jgi:hypothetical protein